ncbi:MAG TPA: tetratricopeptide repeat protein [Bryobacteraceae bacterium]|nr:tetratricopeptide repeat protein [Bryobacteraceae bacterium]
MMFRAILLGALLASGRLLPAQTDRTLLDAQSLIESGKLNDAETAVRQYLETHATSADAHYLLGYILFREGNPKLSIAEYSEGGRYRPATSLDLEAIGADYFLMEDYAAADEWLSKSVALAPHDAHARYYLGRAEYNRKHFAEAAQTFAECLKLEPRNARAEDYLGRSYEALGRTDDAIAAYRRAVALDSSATHNPEPYLDLGNLLTDNSRPGDSIPYLIEAAGMAPNDWRIHRSLGKAYLQANRLPEALAELRKAVALQPDDAPLHFLLAQAMRKSGLADEARAESEKYNALTGVHSSPDSPLAEARSLVELGKFNEAEQVTRKYLEVHKSSADGHYLLGYILFKKEEPKASLAEYTEGARYRTPGPLDLEAVAGDYVLLKDYTDADKWFTKAVEWNPKDSLGWYYLGRTKYNENRFDEAVAAFEQCLKLDAKNVKAEDNLGLSFEGLNQIDKAAAAYRTAIDWQKDAKDKDSGPLLDLGSLLVENNNAADGLPYLLEAERISPEDYRVHRQLGKAYTHLNQLEKARDELEQAAKLAPENAPVHFMLSQVYRRQGLMDKAKIESERYAALAAATSSTEN